MWIDKAMPGVVADLKKMTSSIDSCSWKVMVRGRSEVMGEERTNYRMEHEEVVLMIVEPK